MNKIFKIDFKKLAILLTPSFLRKQKLLAFLQCLLFPIQRIYESLVNLIKSTNYTLNHNGQVCCLQKLLNDKFDHNLRRIRIRDAQDYQRKYIYSKLYNRPKHLGKNYLRSIGSYTHNGYSFEVLVPQDVYNGININELKALIDANKLAGKKYKIIIQTI